LALSLQFWNDERKKEGPNTYLEFL
jgi:hypothetical protein